jgi:putative transcriptional regulator
MPQKRHQQVPTNGYLDGQLLVAMPSMSDRRFAKSVIYMCAHSKDGAMGLIINQRADHIDFHDLLERLGIVPETEVELKERLVHVGGPVETGRGFVLHSADYRASESTLKINSNVCLTATIDILKAMAAGGGPDRAMLALGYASWSAGQLEREIAANGWLNCRADPDLVFSDDIGATYSRAMAEIGINLSHLVGDVGHA